jgi:outer membrane protein
MGIFSTGSVMDSIRLSGLLKTCVFAYILAPLLHAAADDTKLSLQGSIEYAVNYGLTMRTANNQYAPSVASLVAARQTLAPTARATLSTGGRRTFSSRTTDFSAVASIGADYELSPSHFLAFRSARQNTSAAQRHLDQERSDITAQVIIQYIRTIGAEKLIEVKRESVEYQQKKLMEIEAFFQQGIKAHAEVLQQRSVLAGARSDLLKSVQDFQKTELALLDMLGLPFGNGYRLDSSDVVVLLDRCSNDTSFRVDTIAPETDEIRAQQFRIASAEASLTSCRLSYVPSLSFSAGWSMQEHTNSNVRTGSDAITNAADIGASLVFPLLDQKQRWVKVRNAEILLESAGLELERLQRLNSLAIRQAVLDDSMGTELVFSALSRLESAKESLLATEERYKAGVSTLTDLNAAQANYTDAQNGWVEARFDRLVNRINLFHATGRIDRIVATVKEGRPDEKR